MIDNRVMFNAAMNYGQEQAAQLRQPQAAQAFLATHQLKTQQLKSEGRIADIEEQDDSSALKNERDGDGEGYQGGPGKRKEREPEEDLPGIALGKDLQVVMRGPNNPLRFDASV